MLQEQRLKGALSLSHDAIGSVQSVTHQRGDIVQSARDSSVLKVHWGGSVEGWYASKSISERCKRIMFFTILSKRQFVLAKATSASPSRYGNNTNITSCGTRFRKAAGCMLVAPS